MIGRGGSSLKDKNVLPVRGVPLLLWAAAAARSSVHINRYYVSSDDEIILGTAARAGYAPISRPVELASDTAQSCDAVRHALDVIERDEQVDVLVVQHANVGTVTGQMIDDCIDILMANDSATSVVPAHENSDYHPMRAQRVGADGSVEPFVPGNSLANRQQLPKAVFFDHSFWVVRGRDAVFDAQGWGPWPCMGRRVLPYLTQGCFDVHTLEDLAKTEAWTIGQGLSPPQF